MSKNGWLVLVVGVNLALLAGIWLKVGEPREARAQAFAGMNPYLVVTGKSPAGGSAAIYILEMTSRTLFVMQPDALANIIPLDRRDLNRDFGRNAAGVGGGRP